MKILLIGNYVPDKQHSMLRFASMLHDGLTARGHTVRVAQPSPVLGNNTMPAGINKWMRYIDKYLIFPGALKRVAEWADIVHICDHSNAVYAPHVTKSLAITCHDLLAVRGALGEPTYCPASKSGSILQKWILNSIANAGMIVCDSHATKNDVKRLARKSDDLLKVIHVALDRPYQKIETEEAKARLMAIGIPLNKPFLLMVGSAEPRKNRQGALRIFAEVRKQFDCSLVIAGGPLTPDLRSLSTQLAIASSITEVSDTTDDILVALYNLAFALLFPSHCEGFGLPIIEAQACGCPVVASDCAPLPEVSGDAALHVPVQDEGSFTHAVWSLRDQNTRDNLIRAGLENAGRFTIESMCEQYESVYRSLLKPSPVSMQVS